MTTDTTPEKIQAALEHLAKNHVFIPNDELRHHCLTLIDNVAAYISKTVGEAPPKCVEHLVAATHAATRQDIPVIVHQLDAALLALELLQRPKPTPRKKNPQLHGHADNLLTKLKQKKTPTS